MSVVENDRVDAPTLPLVTEADVLNRAADLLEEFGWCQGNCAVDSDGLSLGYYDDGVVAFCVGGAFARAWDDLAAGECDGHKVFSKTSLLSPLLGLGPGREQHWNDTADRTKAEVVQRLREAAKAAA